MMYPLINKYIETDTVTLIVINIVCITLYVVRKQRQM